VAKELPDGYREPLLLKCVHGMSYREIGEVMGLPESTIETRIARGRRMLREAAEQAEHEAHASRDRAATRATTSMETTS
jgi:DNA-directed RNA polymerase specialized sigma24 family protein